MIRNSVHRAHVTNLRDEATGTLRTSADTSCKVQVLDRTGATVQAATFMTYVGPGEWRYDVPASVFVAGADPWETRVTVYDVAGTTALLTLRSVGRDQPVMDW